MPDLLLVWAPCGCYWAGGYGGSFITPCGRDICNFQWSEVQTALLALEQAERELPKEKIHAVIDGAAQPVVAATTSTETPTQIQAPEDSIDAQRAVNELIDAMISEGGPSDHPADPPISEKT
jgi:hypothetical protein